MKNTRFAEMVSAIEIADHKRFTDLVNSPYFNKNSRVTKLWKYIKTNGYEDESFLKENMSKAIFGNQRFTEANFRMVISSFVKLIEEYLLQREYEINQMECKIRLLEIFQKNNLKKSFSKYLNEIENKLDGVKKKDSTYYYRKYFIECLKIQSGKGGDKFAAGEYASCFSRKL